MILCRKKLAPVAGVALFLFFASAGQASAQMTWTDRAFVNASIGQQWMDQRLVSGASFEIYEETGNWEAVMDVDDSIVFDVSAGYRVWKNLALAVGYSRTSDTHDTSLAAAIPDTLRFDTPHHDTRELTGYDREESAFHVSAVWMVPVTDKIDFALMAGPSFFSVKQPFLSAITVTPGGTTIGTTTDGEISESATGYHVAVDGTFRIMRNVGLGGMLRYAKGEIDAPGIVAATLDAGGFQALAGVRIRF